MTTQIFKYNEQIEQIKATLNISHLPVELITGKFCNSILIRLSPHQTSQICLSKETWDKQNSEEILSVIAHELKHLQIWSCRSARKRTLISWSRFFGSHLNTYSTMVLFFDFLLSNDLSIFTLCLFILSKPLQFISVYEEYLCDQFAANFTAYNPFKKYLPFFYELVFANFPKTSLALGLALSFSSHPFEFLRYAYCNYLIHRQNPNAFVDTQTNLAPH